MIQDENADQPLRGGAASGQWPPADRQRIKRRSLPTTLLVGHSEDVGALRRRLLRQPPRDFEVIGCCVSLPGDAGHRVEGLPVLGGPDDVVDVVRRYAVDTVAIVPPTGLDSAAWRRLETDLRTIRADLLLAPTMSGADGSRMRRPPAGRRRPARGVRPGLHGARALLKGSFDRAVAVLLLLFLLPLFVGVAMAVKASSRGPVFVGLIRVGRDGRLFRLLKFRTVDMPTLPGIDALAEQHRGADPSQIRTDHGDTPLGRVLRRSCIDGLPQLLNVLRGDMSLVGPRPGLPWHTTPAEHALRPGLVALAPVGGRPDLFPLDRVPTDVDYVENWSLLLDLTILRKSLAAAVRGGGAG